MAKIGFVGLGHMGLPMAINLVKAGHRVVGYDLQPAAMHQFAQSGGQIAQKIQEAAQEQDVLITMLQTGEQVLSVCEGSHGLLSTANKGALFIDCSTIDVPSARNIHQLAKTHLLEVLDAPVSGGEKAAVAGTLTFIVGGEEQAFQAGLPILSAMGQKVIHTGGAGSGQAAKICNNLILGISMIAVAEAFTLGDHLGLDAKKLFEVVSNASGQCWTMSNYVPVPGILDTVPADHHYKAGFTATMMLKDLVLGNNAAEAAHIALPLGAKAKALYQQFKDQGLGDLDFSAIIKLLA